MWVTGLDTTYYEIGKKIELFVSMVPVAVILYAIYTLNQQMELTVKRRIIAGLTVGLVSILISSPFIEIYHHFMNPEWFDAVLRLQEESMLSSGASEGEIAARLEQMRAGNTTLNSVMSAYISGGIIFPAIVSLVSIPFIKSNKEKNEAED
jgi:hypothetical protein